MNSMQLYDMCISRATESPCQKRGFGCVLLINGEVAAHTCNQPIEPASHLCDAECVRFKIPSGSDSLIGACGHAEEHAIWEAIRKHGDISGKMALLYVAGVTKPDNNELVNLEPYFYCIRCATLMHYARVWGVNVWVNNAWSFLTTSEAYQSSLKFALKESVQ